MEMPISHPAWLLPPQMWEAVTLWPGLYSPLQSSLCALKKLSLIPWHMLEILWLSSWWRFCLNEALQQITQDLVRQREKENASLIWNPTVRERSNPLLLQSQQLTLKTALLSSRMRLQEKLDDTHVLKHSANTWTCWHT